MALLQSLIHVYSVMCVHALQNEPVIHFHVLMHLYYYKR